MAAVAAKRGCNIAVVAGRSHPCNLCVHDCDTRTWAGVEAGSTPVVATRMLWARFMGASTASSDRTH